MKHTKGKWVVAKHSTMVRIESDKGIPVANVNWTLEEYQNNAQLIAEAGTVANETGMTPRQLAEQNKELLGALKVAETKLSNFGGYKKHMFETVKETKETITAAIEDAIKKAEDGDS